MMHLPTRERRSVIHLAGGGGGIRVVRVLLSELRWGVEMKNCLATRLRGCDCECDLREAERLKLEMSFCLGLGCILDYNLYDELVC